MLYDCEVLFFRRKVRYLSSGARELLMLQLHLPAVQGLGKVSIQRSL